MATTPHVFQIYVLKNKQNGNCYVGATSNIHRRLLCHQQDAKRGSVLPIHAAIRKYGFDNFEVSVVADTDTWDRACRFEKDFIKDLNSFKVGYNCTLGGDGRVGIPHCEETKQKISLSMMGKNRCKRTQEQKERQRLTHLGKKHTQETKQKISLSNKGKEFSMEHREHLSASQIGRKHSEETKDKISKAKAKNTLYQFTNPGLGLSLVCPCFEFCKEFKMNKSSVWRVVHGERNSVHGWEVASLV